MRSRDLIPFAAVERKRGSNRPKSGARPMASPSNPDGDVDDPAEQPDHDAARALNHLLHRSAQQADAHIEDALADLQLTARQFAVLDRIDLSPATNQNRLGQITGIDRSTLVNIIDRLQRRGLMERGKSTLDRRESVLQLTTEGVAVLAAARPAVEQANTNLLKMLPGDFREAFVRCLEHFVHPRDDGDIGA